MADPGTSKYSAEKTQHVLYFQIAGAWRISFRVCLGIIWGMSGALSGVSSGASSGACLGQYKISAVLYASLMPFCVIKNNYIQLYVVYCIVNFFIQLKVIGFGILVDAE